MTDAAGETRTGIKIVDQASHETTDINFPGLTPSFIDLQQFEKKLRKLVKPGRWFVVAGSLPVGISLDFFAFFAEQIQPLSANLTMEYP